MAQKTENTSTVRLRHTNGNWLFLTRVQNLEISPELRPSIKINQTELIRFSATHRHLRKLGISELSADKLADNLGVHSPTETLAVVHRKGKPDEIEPQCIDTIRSDLNLLAASQLWYCKRESMCRIAISGECERGINQFLFANKETNQCTGKQVTVDRRSPLTLDRRWVDFHKHFFFSRFMALGSKKQLFDKKWANVIRRAVQGIGRGINAYDSFGAFLWNMIALEILLTKEGDKFSQVLPLRIEAIMGWASHWEPDKYEARVAEVYKKRCNLVHEGDIAAITLDDINFTDEILVNILTNIFRNPKHFSSKECLVRFADQLRAERLLAGKRKVRPTTLLNTRKV